MKKLTGPFSGRVAFFEFKYFLFFDAFSLPNFRTFKLHLLSSKTSLASVTSKFLWSKFWNLKSTFSSKWNVTPLLGHFGGRVGTFFIEPSFALSAPLSFYLLLIALSFLFPLEGVCMLAGPKACLRDCNKCIHPTIWNWKESAISYK